MKKTLLLVFLLVFLIVLLFASDKANLEAEKDAIKQAALDYIEGWYEGNAERMERALHPDLTKRGVQVLPQTSRTLLNYASASNMVEYTRAGLGKNPEKKQKIEVTILDVFKNMACVKTMSPDFVDYLQIAKYNGEWKIVNVLWEMNK